MCSVPTLSTIAEAGLPQWQVSSKKSPDLAEWLCPPSHRMPLRDAPNGYRIFQKKQDDCTKVLLKV
ncbi:hypothetical protein AB0J14_14240 [Micromonospora arborensis]|uniref:hypothetical protein n=1 Tax=Micromonospora arborensis TaxID=2116518 RepID=UPI0033C92A95